MCPARAWQLVQIQFGFALIAFHGTAKNLVAAFRTYIAGLLLHNPSFSSEFSSKRYGPQNDFLANGHGKTINVLTRKNIAFVTTRVTFSNITSPDLTLPAMHEKIIRQTSATMNIFLRKLFAVGKCSFAWSTSLVQVYESLLEFFVIVPRCNINSANTAIKTAGRNEVRI
ncbi:MAG: hypothetical protein AUK25_09565 [Desulfobacteraceae bacterium CG2_30_51_40]|nr:MAG: hypothetical protein AUK25_09565 [Desulfobacteraceae bacterium CG2_30_51_40]